MKLLNILSSSALTTLLLYTPLISAHGVVYRVLIDGKEYKGNMPNASPQPSVIRQVNDVGPVKGTSNPDMKCGLSARPASDIAQANPGSTLQFDWRGPSLTPWPHRVGPMMTYMASCGSDTCDKFDPTNAEWFLIDRQGPSSNGTWAQADVANGGMAKVQIPSNLKAGNYMMRHEIISLQNAVSEGGAEFYPSCIQLNVDGSQTGAPQQSDLVQFPGAYKDSDPGIYDPNVYNPGSSYTFPGPNVASFISGSSTSGSGSGGSSNSGSGSSDGNNNTSSSGNNGNNSGSGNYGNNGTYSGSGNNGNNGTNSGSGYNGNNGTSSGSGNSGSYGNNTSSGTCRLRRKKGTGSNSTSDNPSNNTSSNPSGDTPNSSNNNASSNYNTTGSSSDSGSGGYNKRALGVLFHRRQLRSQPRSLGRIMRDFFYRSGEGIH